MLDAIAFQTRDVIEAMTSDCQKYYRETSRDKSVKDVADTVKTLPKLRVDGGVSASDIMMQILADVLGMEVVRPGDVETTVRGAAMAASIGANLSTKGEFYRCYKNDNCAVTSSFTPSMNKDEREINYMTWKKAVERSFDSECFKSYGT